MDTDSEIDIISENLTSTPTINHSLTFKCRDLIQDIPLRIDIDTALSMSCFKDIKHIANGGNATIFLAKYNKNLVVIKMMKANLKYPAIISDEFDIELAILSRCDHPNVMKIVGAGMNPRKFLVVEYLGGKTLDVVLDKLPWTTSPLQRCLGVTLSRYRDGQLLFALKKGKELAMAMYYMHSISKDTIFLHRDLKPNNIGFTAAGDLKIFDFGLSTWLRRSGNEHEAYLMTGNTGSLRYMAPEVCLQLPYNDKVDVYSFSIILWQMAKNKLPFKDLNKAEFLSRVVRSKERPKIDKRWPAAFITLLTRCWDDDHVNRPQFKSIVETLDQVLEQQQNKASSLF